MQRGEREVCVEKAWCLAAVPDGELQRSLSQLLQAGARTEARVVAHLAEIETRGLHLRLGCESLFQYCLERLGLGDFEAFLRITAARVARKYPVVFDLLERREIHLTAIRLLRDHLTPENHRELLAAASHQSKRQIEKLLAMRFPRADVPERLRRLPQLEPLSPGRYRLELTIGEELKGKLELARDLLSHANPSGDLGAVIDRGMDELLDQLQKRRFGRTQRRSERGSERENESARKRESGSARERESGSAREGEGTGLALRRAWISNEVRRRLVERDGLRCAYVGCDGKRCTARAFLQIHHKRSWARGGPDTLDNLQLLCGRHNRWLGELEFGERDAATRSPGPGKVRKTG